MVMSIPPQPRKLFEKEASRLLKKEGYLSGSIIEAILFEMARYVYQHVHMSLNEFLSTRIQEIEEEIENGGSYHTLQIKKETLEDIQYNF